MVDASYRSADEIMQTALFPARLILSDKFMSGSLKVKDFQELSQETLDISADFPGFSQKELAGEISKAEEFLKTGKIPEIPSIDHPLTQYIWGLALAIAETDKSSKALWDADKKELPIHKLDVWKDIKESQASKAELKRHAFMIQKSALLNSEVKMRWGACKYPQVGHYYSPKANIINVDMLWGLIGGYEHTRSAQLHEIGHSQGTVLFTKKMIQLAREHNALKKKKRSGHITPEEEKMMPRLKKEFKFRFDVLDEAENNYANRFAVNATSYGFLRQDIAYDLNYKETALYGAGKNIIQNKEPDHPLINDTVGNRAYNLRKSIRWSFFVNNGIVPDDENGWAELGINKDWIEYTNADGQKTVGKEAFDKLRDMAKQLELLQPTRADYALPAEERKKIVYDFAAKRCEIIEEIYDCFAAPYYEQAIKEATQENEEKSERENEQGGDQENNGQQTTSQYDDHGLDTMTDKEDKSDQDDNDPDADNPYAKDMEAPEDEGNGKGKGDADGEGETEKDEKKEESDEDLPENPQEMNERKIKKQKEETKEDEEDKGESITQIIRTPLDKQDVSTPRSLQQTQPIPFNFPKTLMPENEFSKIVNKNLDLIKKLKEELKKLHNQYMTNNPQSRNLTMLPQQGNLEVDMPSFTDRIKKQRTGQQISESDFENFYSEAEKKEMSAAPIDLAILIDTSGSMSSAGTDKFAIELACSLYQAARDDSNFNVYIALMTNPTAWIGKPGDNSVELSRRLASILNSGGDDDKIGDNIQSVLSEVAKRAPSKEKEGYTHFFMITDGDHTDSDSSFALVEDLIGKKLPVTFNWVLTNSLSQSFVHSLTKKHQTGMGCSRIDVAENVSKKDMATKLMKLLEGRVADAKKQEAMDVILKKKLLSRAIDKNTH